MKTFARLALLVLIVSFGISGLYAQGITLDLRLDQETLLAGAGIQKAYLKIGLKGREGKNNRPPLNLSLVLDRSGSMAGDKLERAKDAAVYAVNMLEANDIVSIIIYDDEAQVLVPATKARDKNSIIRQIRNIEDGGSTALFAGVSLGAGQIRKFKESEQVNRIILLSDGMANVGPDSPQELGRLGSSLRKEGISVSTIGLGLGYNEDLMSRLALNSDGNHAFVEEARDLVRIFDSEFKDALSIVASNIKVTITCEPGVRPLRIMNRDGDILGQDINLQLNQVLGSQEKIILVELEVPAGKSGAKFSVAKANAVYTDFATRKSANLKATAAISYTNDKEKAAQSVQNDVKEQVVLQIATEANERAVELMDTGDEAGAKKILESNSLYLKEAAEALASPALQSYADQNMDAITNIENEEWDSQRKVMREEQAKNKSQRSY